MESGTESTQQSSNSKDKPYRAMTPEEYFAIRDAEAERIRKASDGAVSEKEKALEWHRKQRLG